MLLTALQEGTGVEREHALRQLNDQARETRDPEDGHFLALGLEAMGRWQDAIRVLESIVASVPANEIYRSNLASIYLAAGQLALATHHFNYLAEHGSVTMRDDARRELHGIEARRRKLAGESELRRLQVERLRERFASLQAQAGAGEADIVGLAHVLLDPDVADTDTARIEEAIAVLEDGHRRFPSSVRILEYLVTAYADASSTSKMVEAAEKLERLDPDSPFLEAAHTTPGEMARFHDDMLLRLQLLVEQAHSSDVDLAAAAVAQLERIVTEFPMNTEYRAAYGFALVTTGRKADAHREAMQLARFSDDSHVFHFNVGGLFLATGDPGAAAVHVERALDLAETDEERDDALELRIRLTAT